MRRIEVEPRSYFLTGVDDFQFVGTIECDGRGLGAHCHPVDAVGQGAGTVGFDVYDVAVIVQQVDKCPIDLQ